MKSKERYTVEEASDGEGWMVCDDGYDAARVSTRPEARAFARKWNREDRLRKEDERPDPLRDCPGLRKALSF